MLEILITLDADNVLNQIRASGHAGDAVSGTNIVCAAATSLLRSACRTISSDKEICSKFSAGDRGQIDFYIYSCESEKKRWLKGITDYLLTGLTDLDNEYPEDFRINIKLLKEI